VTACAPNKGPATSAYLRQCRDLSAKIAGQIRDQPAIAMPTRPSLPANPTDDQQRIFDGMMRLYPLYVNQYYGAVIARCRAVSLYCSRALDDIGALDAAGVDPAGVQVMTLQVQVLDQQRGFFDDLCKLAEESQTALVRRKAVDEADERLVLALSAASGWADPEAAGPAMGAMKDAAAAVARRPAEPFGVGEQVARVGELGAKLQDSAAACQAECARLAAGLQAKYPGQDWSAAQPAKGQPGH